MLSYVDTFTHSPAKYQFRERESPARHERAEQGKQKNILQRMYLDYTTHHREKQRTQKPAGSPTAHEKAFTVICL